MGMAAIDNPFGGGAAGGEVPSLDTSVVADPIQGVDPTLDAIVDGVDDTVKSIPTDDLQFAEFTPSQPVGGAMDTPGAQSGPPPSAHSSGQWAQVSPGPSDTDSLMA